MAILLRILPVILSLGCLNYAYGQQVKDIDGNVYQTLQIGNQVWMTGNLEVSHYRNGDAIPVVTQNEAWKNLTSGAWSCYNNDTAIGNKYGKLYNWYAVNDPRGLCPDGWHVPTDGEWKEFIELQGGELIAGAKVKTGNEGGTGDLFFGLSGLFAGYRTYKGKYLLKDEYIGFWSSTEGNSDFVWVRYLNNYDAKFAHTFIGKSNGVSCRCIKD